MEVRTRSRKRNSAASHQIQFRACCDGVERLDPLNEDSFSFDISCVQCGKVTPNVKIPLERVENETLNEYVNYVHVCDKCQHTNRIEILRNFVHTTAGISNEWEPLFNIDCRECRVDIVYCSAWKITAKGGKVYEWDGKEEFFQYDDQSNHPVGVTDLDFFVKTLD